MQNYHSVLFLMAPMCLDFVDFCDNIIPQSPTASSLDSRLSAPRSRPRPTGSRPGPRPTIFKTKITPKRHWLHVCTNYLTHYHIVLSDTYMNNTLLHVHTYNRLMVICPGPPVWAGSGIRRNIHPLTSLLIIRHPLSTSAIFYD